VASEKGRAQTDVTQWCADLCDVRVVRLGWVLHEPKGVTNLAVNRILLERGTIAGDSPVGESGPDSC
jgi:hypothetical protein